MKVEEITTRIEQLITLAGEVRSLSAEQKVAVGKLAELRSGGLAFIDRVFSSQSIFYREFDDCLDDTSLRIPGIAVSIIKCIGILNAMKTEVEGGYLTTIKGLITAEVFTDFLEMAGYLLSEGYKDPAAVMIGSVLEEHLRQLCTRNGVDSTVQKDGKSIPKTADRMNADLAAAGTYSKLYQKGVTGWLDLRNKAAHGHYAEYDKAQVDLMEQSVIDFVAKTS
jgi:hypothetical protein